MSLTVVIRIGEGGHHHPLWALALEHANVAMREGGPKGRAKGRRVRVTFRDPRGGIGNAWLLCWHGERSTYVEQVEAP